MYIILTRIDTYIHAFLLIYTHIIHTRVYINSHRINTLYMHSHILTRQHAHPYRYSI